MLRYINSEKMGRGTHGWLDSHFHFSFAEYYNPDNIQFGVLHVVNDDMVEPGTGFDTHPRKDMEIISYVVEGELTHGDNMGNRQTLTRGQVQYMSAGSGVLHSEYNLGKGMLRFLQIWILPDKKGLQPRYGDYRFKLGDRVDKWLPIATGADNMVSQAPIRMHQDVNLFATIISEGDKAECKVGEGRQIYMVLVEGEADVNGIHMRIRDALEATEELLVIEAKQRAHVLLVEMEKA